jgi:receptor-interacting serine/threonine-protein kinase 4
LSNRANVNQADEEGYTPLHFAAQTGDEITGQLLLKNGAHIEARDRLHVTPLMVAKENKKDGMIRLLSNSTMINQKR